MAYSLELAGRMDTLLRRKREISKRFMFGGVCYLLRDKMFCGLVFDRLMVRVGPQRYEALLKKPHVRPMDFTGSPMRGFIYVMPDGLNGAALSKWVGYGLRYVSTLSAGSSKPSSARRHGPKRGRRG
jgi:hypothetical protein